MHHFVSKSTHRNDSANINQRVPKITKSTQIWPKENLSLKILFNTKKSPYELKIKYFCNNKDFIKHYLFVPNSTYSFQRKLICTISFSLYQKVQYFPKKIFFLLTILYKLQQKYSGCTKKYLFAYEPSFTKKYSFAPSCTHLHWKIYHLHQTVSISSNKLWFVPTSTKPNTKLYLFVPKSTNLIKRQPISPKIHTLVPQSTYL